jgi:hypothetical protein
MKKPKSKTTPAESPCAKPVETSGIYPIMWPEGFAVAHGTMRRFTQAVRLFRYDKPNEHAGKKLHWAVEVVNFAEDKKTVLEIREQTWFENEQQALEGHRECVARTTAARNKDISRLAAANAHKPTCDEQDLTQARLKVMREQYPDTFKAMDALAKAQPQARPAAVEALFRAYTVDKVRLHKPANLGDILPFKSIPDDMSFILEIAKAHKAKSPRDPVDVEIAARWFAAGYDKMSLAEYTDAINAKTGAKLKRDAMKARRLKKFRLLSSNPEGGRSPNKSPNREI